MNSFNLLARNEEYDFYPFHKRIKSFHFLIMPIRYLGNILFIEKYRDQSSRKS